MSYYEDITNKLEDIAYYYKNLVKNPTKEQQDAVIKAYSILLEVSN